MATQTSTPVLGYWPIRGLANPIRLLLEYVGQKYEFKEWGSEWFQEKQNLGIPFPNLPYYIDDRQKMSQSGAIMRYLGRKHKLIATSEDDMIKQDILDGLMQDFRFAWAYVVYLSPNKIEDDKAKYFERIDPVLKELDQSLGRQDYVIGSYLTYNDFVFFELLDVNQKLFPDILEKYANLKRFHERIGNLKGVKEYMQSDRNPKKINGSTAKWGG